MIWPIWKMRFSRLVSSFHYYCCPIKCKIISETGNKCREFWLRYRRWLILSINQYTSKSLSVNNLTRKLISFKCNKTRFSLLRVCYVLEGIDDRDEVSSFNAKRPRVSKACSGKNLQLLYSMFPDFGRIIEAGATVDWSRRQVVLSHGSYVTVMECDSHTEMNILFFFF
jgi:hypothetical protein